MPNATASRTQMRDMRQTLRNAFDRVLRLENRRVAVRPGRLEKIHGFQSATLGNARDITIYLPAGYDERPDRRYPVLYLGDGQNLFEPERAFIPGQHWKVREAADEAIGSRTAEPMIIVGVDNTGAQRLDEYTPTRDAARNAGGRAADYAKFLIDELKPRIDATYRSDPARSAIGGSSLGGLVSLYLAMHHPDVFPRAAVMSPSVWWNGRSILGDVETFEAGEGARLWLDIGGREGQEALTDARELRDRLQGRGWTQENFRYYEDRRADHSERSWAGRIRQVLEFLFPPVG
jgi:predicted alpha/beta superfamily hydrolase